MAAPPLVTDESPGERSFDYDRTVALSDGVFAIALTLLVLNISAPAVGHGKLSDALLDRGTEFESYAISFAVIALLWVRHHGFFRGVTTIDGRLTLLNLAYLGFVAFLPYPTRILGVYGGEAASVALYAITVAIISTIGGAMRTYAVRASLLSEEGRRELARREHWAIAPVIFLGSIPVAFASAKAAELLWLLLLVAGLRARTARRRA
jgi:TMEM175 potassium channel family protein